MIGNKIEPNPKILITGASGNVGSAVVSTLESLKVSFAIAQSKYDGETAGRIRHLDFTNPNTFASALLGIRQVFLLRPPALANVGKYFEPFIDKCKELGVEQIVFLSLQGVENNSLTPHHKIEKYIQTVGIPYTFVRPSFFMQNLTTTHLTEIQHGEIYVPAGSGKTNFVDTRDVGAVVAKVLVEKERHLNKAYEITGSKAYSYYEIAEILSDKLGRQIVYKNPNPIAFLWRKVREGLNPSFAMVMLALYSVAKMGKADGFSADFEKLMGRRPMSFERFVDDHLELFKTI